jgi:hypothetical protein
MDVPWTKGENPEYSAFVIEVHVRKDRSGALRSFRRLQDDQDERVSASFGMTGGMEEGAWALIVESVRAEAMLQVLVQLSNDPDFKKKLVGAEGPAPELIERSTAATMQVLRRVLDQVGPSLVEEALRNVHHGLRREHEAE